ncbi:MAG: galactokinase [Chloroflexota bacterium]
MQKFVEEKFEEKFGEQPPIIVQAPGRVNLIGEHTDYNDGFVLPMAINRAVWVALRLRPDKQVHVTALDLDETAVFDLTNITNDNCGWIEYLKGMAWAMQNAGYELSGWEGVFSGNVPRGAGLSSSAALEMATARAFHAVSEFEWVPSEMAKLGQITENKWVGVNSGIMDQMISASGQEGNALLIDCRSLQSELVPLPHTVDGSKTVVVILDSATRHTHVDSGYNERREQCEKAAKYFEVKALRDVSISEFLESGDGLEEVTYRRAKHVVTENLRTLNAAKSMKNADVELLGQLMNESHISMRDDFEISTKELDAMVEIAQSQEGCYGARMTGGGFGGCAVALVHAEHVDDFVTAVAKQYKTQTNIKPNVYVCHPSPGASQIK